MDYYNKYVKYKTKYLNLKYDNNQYGGGIVSCHIRYKNAHGTCWTLPPKSPEKQTCKQVEDNPRKLTKHTIDLLRESEAFFYGHDRCGYCKKQTELFVKHSDEKTPLKDIYVNCQNEPDRCRDISGYPTWEIAGKTFVGYHDMKDLCQIAELAIEDKEVSLGHK